MALINEFELWLRSTVENSSGGRYRHQLLTEDPAVRAQALEQLKVVVEQAYEDIRRHFRGLAHSRLNPVRTARWRDPTEGFPEQLTMTTLQGHFGEILAGVIAENFQPLGEPGWAVPAYLFRFHRAAFHELERSRQTGEPVRQVFGRTGDDCLAFQMGDDGLISHCLFCEAKCTTDHESGLITDAHESISSNPLTTPISIDEVIEVLQEKNDETLLRWVDALQILWMEGPSEEYERCDMVCYVCGRRPIQNETWIPRTQPHPSYTAPRRLEAVETHIENVEELIRAVFHVGNRRQGGSNA